MPAIPLAFYAVFNADLCSLLSALCPLPSALCYLISLIRSPRRFNVSTLQRFNDLTTPLAQPNHGPPSASQHSVLPYGRLYYLPFPARHSAKARRQRRSVAPIYLADNPFLEIPFRMAQYLRLTCKRRCFSGRGKSAGRLVFLGPDCSGLLCSC